MMGTVLPPELWQQILEENTLLPAFLDAECLPEVVDPLFVNGPTRNSQPDSEYWKMERHLNTLRQVCKAWQLYLQRFAHRYFKITDALHGHVPIAALSKAIRVDFGMCLCCYTHQAYSLLEDIGELSAEIISWNNLSYPTNIFNRANMPLLRAIVSPIIIEENHVEGWSENIEYAENLSFLRLEDLDLDWPAFSPKNLTTLSYSCTDFVSSSFLTSVDLPSLRHLRFTTDAFTIGLNLSLIIFHLTSLGQKLRSLQLGTSGFYWKSVPEDVWSICPHLERLDSRLEFLYPPPSDHPIHTISLPGLCELDDEEIDTPISFSGLLMGWPSLRRVIFNGDKKFPSENYTPRCYARILELIKEFKRRGVIVEDSAGAMSKDEANP